MTQREEFEKIFSVYNLGRSNSDSEKYGDRILQRMWEAYTEGWKAAKAQAVPEGYRLMPPEPTPEMIKAWRESPFSDDHEENLASGYDAMFFAAPEQNKGGE